MFEVVHISLKDYYVIMLNLLYARCASLPIICPVINVVPYLTLLWNLTYFGIEVSIASVTKAEYAENIAFKIYININQLVPTF